MSILSHHPPISKVLREAHESAFVGLKDYDVLARYLADKLGRPTVARLTGTPDPNTITRWAMRKNEPGEARIDRMRHAAYVFNALVGLGLSETNARQWFRGANPSLGDEMPMDVLKRDDYQRVIAAVRSYASA
jgi:uncharacterized protein (DUF2384 family)